MPFETKINFNGTFNIVLLFIKAYPIKHRLIAYVFSDYYKKHKKLFDKRGYTKENEYKNCKIVRNGHYLVVIKQDGGLICRADSLSGRKVIVSCKPELKKKEVVC